jgi:hypothetical protein
MPSASASWIERLVTPLSVTLAVCAVWAVWTAGELRRAPVGTLVNVGQRFLDQGKGASETIDRHHVEVAQVTGYDGQFFYYMALDPRHSPAYIDEPGYRYSRVVYPFLARAVSLGHPAAVPWALLLVNLAAVAGGTYALAALLHRRGASPIFAALYGFAPGLYIGVEHDLSEPLAYALVLAALAVWWWDDDRPRPWLVGATLALAVLTRESTYLFALALAVAAFIGLHDGIERRRFRDVRSALIVGLTALLPYVILRLLLLAWLGSSGSSPEAARFAIVPFGGFLSHWPLSRTLLEQLWGVVLPSLVALALVAWFTRRLGPSLLALVLNVAVLVVFLPTPSYDSLTASARITLGVVCAFLACLPLIPSTARAEVALVVAVLGMAPWYALFPSAFGR